MAIQIKDALKTVGGISTSGAITTTGNGNHNIGSTSNRFNTIIGTNIHVYDANAQHYASLRTTTVGTADTQGVGRLVAGNSVASGTAGNAKGQIVLYGTNTGYTLLTPGYNSTSSVTATLPSASGTLPIMTKGDTSYWGMLAPDGGTSWIRTTTSGLIPYDQNKGSALGTSSWPFGNIYGTTIYEDGTSLTNKYAAKSHGTHLTIGTGAGNAAAGNHTHSYLPLSGGNLTGSISLTTDNTGITGVCGGGTDQWTIVGGGTNDNGYLEIRTRDNGNEPIYVRQYDANGLVRTAALLDGNGATSFPGLISEGGTRLTDKYAAKSHGHNEIWVKDAPFNSSNDTTANWGGQGVSVSWYPDGTTITNKPNNWGFIFNIGRGTEVHQMWFSQATGTTYHRGGNGSGWSGSWRAMLDSDNFSSYAAPASHSHSYLSTGGGTLSGPIVVSGESRFHNGTYSDPWNGTSCAIKATGNIAATGIIKANGRMDIQGIPLSIQSGAPSCGGVWIQI